MKRYSPNKAKKTDALFLILLLLISAVLFNGCSSSSNDHSDAEQSSVAGIISNSHRTVFYEGVLCVLETHNGAESRQSYTATAYTNSNGKYSFTNVPDGRYKLTASKQGYVTVNSIFYVQGDTVNDVIMTAFSEWNSVYGGNYPYNPNAHYIGVWAAPYQDEHHLGIVSAEINIIYNGNLEDRERTYHSRGYLHQEGSIDWAAHLTYDNGHAFFYDVREDVTHRILVTKDNYSFQVVEDAVTEAGEVTVYVVRGEGGEAPDSSILIPSSSPFGYNLGINYESWTAGRNSRDIDQDLNHIKNYFKLIRTYHSSAIGTTNPTEPIIDPTQDLVNKFVAANGMELAMGTNNNELASGGYGTSWQPGLMNSKDYTDKWVQMLITSFGSKEAVNSHLKVILLGNEVDINGPPPNDAAFSNYYTIWIPNAFNNLKASLSEAGLGSIPISSTIANYPSDHASNVVAVKVTDLIKNNWSPSWNNGKSFVLYNQYTPNWGKSTDFDSVIKYFVSLANYFQGNPYVFIGETGYSAEFGDENQAQVVNNIFSWLEDQYNNGGKTVPLFLFEAYDLPNAPEGQKKFGIFTEDGSNKPIGVKNNINIPSWSTTPVGR